MGRISAAAYMGILMAEFEQGTFFCKQKAWQSTYVFLMKFLWYWFSQD